MGVGTRVLVVEWIRPSPRLRKGERKKENKRVGLLLATVTVPRRGISSFLRRCGARGREVGKRKKGDHPRGRERVSGAYQIFLLGMMYSVEEAAGGGGE